MKDIIGFLRQIGLLEEESQIYMSVLKNGSSSLLQVAKNTGINRTSAYRLCEGLEKKGFLVKSAKWHTTRYESASLGFLQNKVREIEDKTTQIKNTYRSLISSFSALANNQTNQIKVIHYSGKEEVRQLVWNSLKAKTEICSFGYRTLSEPLGKLFIIRWWTKSVKQKIKTRIIANPGTFEMKDSVDKNTKEKYPKTPSNIWQQRIIDPTILPITQENFIYNDVFAIVQWDEKQVFGVEVYNQQVADQERAIFEILWKMAKG